MFNIPLFWKMFVVALVVIMFYPSEEKEPPKKSQRIARGSVTESEIPTPQDYPKKVEGGWFAHEKVLTYADAVEESLKKKELPAPAIYRASWYGPGFHGRCTANGEIYDQDRPTVAHKTLPFGTIGVVEYKGRKLFVVVTDRGPYVEDRQLDLSRGAAEYLGTLEKGVAEVRFTVYRLPLDQRKYMYHRDGNGECMGVS